MSVVAVSSCSDDDEPQFPSAGISYVNPAYPSAGDTLRLLAIGNSFTYDAVQYLSAMFDSAHYDTNRMCIYVCAGSGYGFSHWINTFDQQDSVDIARFAGSMEMANKGTLQQLLKQSWDVIVIQQVSNSSYIWSTFADLERFITLITQSCTNKKVCLAYQMPWAHTADEMPAILDGNIDCVKRMISTYGIDVIIPTGTAIQLARGTELNDSMYLTRDNWHLNLQMGRYIASCTWMEKLICPVFGGNILYNKARPSGDYSDQDILLGQRCAYQAVRSPYNYTSLKTDSIN